MLGPGLSDSSMPPPTRPRLWRASRPGPPRAITIGKGLLQSTDGLPGSRRVPGWLARRANH